MIAAPFAAALLGDMGAEIIKLELPGAGDSLRHVAPMYANRSLYWSVLGRNKCSITLDLHASRGRELFLDLVRHSDGIIENFRPGTLAALLERERNGRGGQWVDVSLYESVFRLLEAVVPAYGKNGAIRERNGNRTGQSSPIGSYRTADDRYMVLSVSTDRVWLRMTQAMGHPEWASDPRYMSNPERTKRPDEVDALVSSWFALHTAADAQEILDSAGV